MFGSGRLTARLPTGSGKRRLPQPTTEPSSGQLKQLVSDGRRQALLYIPASCRPSVAAPLILTLHGAGADARDGMHHLMGHADAYGTLLVSPQSRGSTWDMLRGGFGPDVEFVNAALQKTFEQCTVDPQRICVSGFSDGASYALSLGLANGDLFTHVAAFSPGFMRPPCTQGSPSIYVSHGVHDRVLRIDYCSRRLVPRLEAGGYRVLYREFDGPHTVPPSIAEEALSWFVGCPHAAEPQDDD